MKGIRNVLAVGASLLFLGSSLHVAHASTPPVDLDAQLSDPGLSEDSAEALILQNLGSSFTTSSYDACEADPNYSPTLANIQYKTFLKSPTGPSIPLKLDRYDPVVQPGTTYPVMVLVYGAAWWRGCKDSYNKEGATAAYNRPELPQLSQRFIVLAPDYRLSCDAADPQLLGSPILPRCGWNFLSTDFNTNTTGAAIHDVQDAVLWARNHADDRCASNNVCWNGKLALVGGSSGGNLVYMATVNLTSAQRPNVVASWSGALELQKLTGQTVYGCDTVTTQYECWKRTNQYACGVMNVTQEISTCRSPVNHYQDASPYAVYTPTSLPPVYFANGGGPANSPPEVISLFEATDFRDLLVSNQWSSTRFNLCVIDAPAHGTGYLYSSTNYWCENDPVPHETVWENTVNWIKPWVTP